MGCLSYGETPPFSIVFEQQKHGEEAVISTVLRVSLLPSPAQ